eukprot:12594-Amphidinium_carterae.1
MAETNQMLTKSAINTCGLHLEVTFKSWKLHGMNLFIFVNTLLKTTCLQLGSKTCPVNSNKRQTVTIRITPKNVWEDCRKRIKRGASVQCLWEFCLVQRCSLQSPSQLAFLFSGSTVS